MNRTDFNQTGGFRLETDTLGFMQSSYTQLAALAGLGGQNYILSGCVVAGSNVENGTVVIDGELLPFVGGAKLQYVVIDEIVENKTFEDGLSKPTNFTRVAKMSSVGSLEFDGLQRVSNLLDLQASIITQETGLWTPTSMNSLDVFSGASGIIFRSGKLVVLTGSFSVTYTAQSGASNGVSWQGFPALGNTFNIPNYGWCLSSDVGGGEFFVSRLTKNPGVDNLGAIIPVPAGTTKSVVFSITIIKQ